MILAASLVVVVSPTYALQVLAVLAGGYGLFFAMTEILQVISPRKSGPSPLRQIDAPDVRAPHAREAFAAVGVALVVLVGIAIAHSLGGPDGPSPAGNANPVACNGYPQLCPRPFNEVSVAASHNSMSAGNRKGWLLANNTGGISEQLQFGIRGLLIDAHYGVLNAKGRVRTDLDREGRNKAAVARQELGLEAIKAAERLVGQRLGQGEVKGKKGVYLCHTLCELGYEPIVDALREVTAFLDRHPDEVVTIFVEDYIKVEDIVRAFRASGLDRYTYEHELGDPWPTLREMIESGDRLLVMSEEDQPGDPPWYHTGFALTQETPFTFKNIEEISAPESCSQNRGTPNSPLFQLNHFIEKFPLSPKLAEKVNSRRVLLSRARLCRAERELQPNLVAVDFYDRGDVLEVV
ncbi:MAG: hypothetical protein H0V29_02015, partial [Thermoleophilaceae bacterium]|nr:hypothetical protein [Thermoleophilaceae bacterium]